MKSLRTLVLIFAFLLIGTFSVHSQSLVFCYKGAWGTWINNVDYNYSGVYTTDYDISQYTDGSGFLLIGKYTRITFFEFRISNYVKPTKNEIKWHLKSGQWYEYTGVVSYYVNDKYPNAEHLARNQKFVEPNPRRDETPCVKRTTTATIKIRPYKKRPECYNLWFDNIGVGLDVRNLKFK